jgi:hypothetical protein
MSFGCVACAAVSRPRVSCRLTTFGSPEAVPTSIRVCFAMTYVQRYLFVNPLDFRVYKTLIIPRCRLRNSILACSERTTRIPGNLGNPLAYHRWSRDQGGVEFGLDCRVRGTRARFRDLGTKQAQAIEQLTLMIDKLNAHLPARIVIMKFELACL